MGSGGPRGLQILRSGACVRGGFDSHAFPPFPGAARAVAALALAGVLLAPAGRAAADSVAGPAAAADSLARGPAPGPAIERLPRAAARRGRADSLARAAPPARNAWHEQPRFVMLRSLLVPGWGQVHNRAWLKAAGVAGAEGWLISALLEDNRAIDLLLDEINTAAADSDVVRHNDAVNRYNARLDASVGRQWLLGGLLAYALVDAYVDAHFRNFDIEFRHDPALPEPLPADPDAPKRGGPARGGGSRLALRWHF